MGREVRMVPADWQHPKTWNAYHREMCFIPLFDGNFAEAAADWDEGAAKWAVGLKENYRGEPRWIPHGETYSYEEWAGERPKAEHYMPSWTPAECTHFMMYETTSEGTPISPAFATPEELARYLANTGASAFADKTATYDMWLATIKRGWAPSAVIKLSHGLESGVAALARDED